MAKLVETVEIHRHVVSIYEHANGYTATYVDVWEIMCSTSHALGHSPEALQAIKQAVQEHIEHVAKQVVENPVYFLEDEVRNGVYLTDAPEDLRYMVPQEPNEGCDYMEMY